MHCCFCRKHLCLKRLTPLFLILTGKFYASCFQIIYVLTFGAENLNINLGVFGKSNKSDFFLNCIVFCLNVCYEINFVRCMPSGLWLGQQLSLEPHCVLGLGFRDRYGYPICALISQRWQDHHCTPILISGHLNQSSCILCFLLLKAAVLLHWV